MKKINLIMLFLLAGSMLSCADSDLLDDYFVQAPRVLAVKVQDPEARPGDPVAMKLLVGGKDIDQNMAEAVSWFFYGEQAVSIGTAAYNQELLSQIPADALDSVNPWLDLAVFARIEIGTKSLTAEKKVRITRNPVGKNPVITAVQVTHFFEGHLETFEVLAGDRIDIASGVKNIALTALTGPLAPGENDRLVFRWYVSTSKNSGGKLYINNDKDTAAALLGPGATASETRADAVFSLRGEEADGAVQVGLYDVYLVVRDNASAPESAADDRFGTDFLYFTVVVQ